VWLKRFPERRAIQRSDPVGERPTGATETVALPLSFAAASGFQLVTKAGSDTEFTGAPF
jgi:hypothetical protein